MSEVTKAAASFWPRPTEQLSTTSPKPHASSNVATSTPKKRTQMRFTSPKPRRMAAALAFMPRPSPVTKPQASVTQFFSDPHKSTPTTSSQRSARKVGVVSRSWKARAPPRFDGAWPMVASANSSRAISV